MNKLNIGYFADGPWAHLALKKILTDDTMCINFICARNDNPDPVLESIAIEYGIEFFTHQNINSDAFINSIKKYKSDIFVSMSFNQIFHNKIINTPRLKTINCHAGKLPFYRGRNILNWALINDENEFGITVHYMDEGVDTGDIILQKCFPIDDSDDYETLLNRAYVGCSDCLYEALIKVCNNQVVRIIQSDIHPVGFYCTARKEGDEIINWNQKSREIFNFVRAICDPGPKARTTLNGEGVKINKVELITGAPNHKGIVGAVVGVDLDSFDVKTSDSCIKVVEWEGLRKPRIGDRFQ